MDIVLFGIQGSGKGTQAKNLAAEFGYSVFETGAELRAIAASGTALGETVKSYIDRGVLAPHDIVLSVVKAAILQRAPDQTILFDGIPRDAQQMEDFDAIMAEVGRSFRGVQLTVDEARAVERILGRAKEQGRADDASEEAIRKRMSIFKEKTLPVVEAYRARGLMTDVDGEGSVEEVYARLKAAIGR